ncbi:hypothetical protein F8M41_014699 [Gigaspora margarita]|uniref:Uncharacterized protein n=1 Tax=Gigaspora margarita TaxID=4874 RepID=A0A8H4ENP9_GIGMA|nr:hypothetical protein F8M41_014699 [Gigaspora margarita]
MTQTTKSTPTTQTTTYHQQQKLPTPTKSTTSNEIYYQRQTINDNDIAKETRRDETYRRRHQQFQTPNFKRRNT